MCHLTPAAAQLGMLWIFLEAEEMQAATLRYFRRLQVPVSLVVTIIARGGSRDHLSYAPLCRWHILRIPCANPRRKFLTQALKTWMLTLILLAAVLDLVQRTTNYAISSVRPNGIPQKNNQ